MKIGRYDIPDLRLFPTLVDATKLIYDKFTSEEISDMEMLARLLGHKSAKSGAFLSKMAALRAYGLIEGRGAVRVSDIGKKLTYATDEDDRIDAIEKAINRIPLWKELRSKYPQGLPEINFWVNLATLAGLEAPDAQRIEGQVKREYLQDLKHLPERKAPVPVTKLEEEAKVGTLPSGVEELKWGDIRIWLPKGDHKAAKKAKSLIELYIKELGETP